MQLLVLQKWAATKKFQGGYAEITGTMTLYITDNESLWLPA